VENKSMSVDKFYEEQQKLEAKNAIEYYETVKQNRFVRASTSNLTSSNSKNLTKEQAMKSLSQLSVKKSPPKASEKDERRIEQSNFPLSPPLTQFSPEKSPGKKNERTPEKRNPEKKQAKTPPPTPQPVTKMPKSPGVKLDFGKPIIQGGKFKKIR
jgi:ABC-type uncharacterized transport system involved in gliding motility auxiliary subunit